MFHALHGNDWRFTQVSYDGFFSEQYCLMDKRETAYLAAYTQAAHALVAMAAA